MRTTHVARLTIGRDVLAEPIAEYLDWVLGERGYLIAEIGNATSSSRPSSTSRAFDSAERTDAGVGDPTVTAGAHRCRAAEHRPAMGRSGSSHAGALPLRSPPMVAPIGYAITARSGRLPRPPPTERSRTTIEGPVSSR